MGTTLLIEKRCQGGTCFVRSQLKARKTVHFTHHFLLEEDLEGEKKEDKFSGKAESRNMAFLAVVGRWPAMFWPTPAQKGKPVVAAGSQHLLI